MSLETLHDTIVEQAFGQLSQQCTAYPHPSHRGKTAAGCTVDSVRNLVLYGFEKVVPIQQSSGNLLVSVDDNGNPTDEVLMGPAEKLAEIRKVQVGRYNRG